MDQKKAALTVNRMIEARAKLIKDHPFFGHLSMGLKLACAPCGTACTDGERLIFDPDFAQHLKSDSEMQFVILHEVLHCALEHCTRNGSRDSELFNIACDIVVNSIILGMWGLDTIKVAGIEPIHLAPDGREGREYNAEEIYQMFLHNHNHSDSDNHKFHVKNRPIDRHDIWKAIGDQEYLRDRWNGKILESAKSCHDTQIPQSVRDVMNELLQRSKVDWKQLLHDFLQYDTYDYSFVPPDRRYSGSDFFLPAYNVNEDYFTVNDIWICVDTSASITDDQLKEALMEIQDAMWQTGMTGSISFFDAMITDPQPFTTQEEFRKITPQGGGGTSFHVIFRYLQEHMYPDLPRAILIFTDGYVFRWPEESEALEVPVLWLISKGGHKDVPWGHMAEL